MTTEEVMMKLAQIRMMNDASTKSNMVTKAIIGVDSGTPESSGISESGSFSESSSVDNKIIPNPSETGPSDYPIEVKELALKWMAEIGMSGKLIQNKITMTRKDYLKHIKGKTRDDILEDPIMHILFRAEEQAEVNFFSWIEKFPKAKDESNQ